MEVGGVRQFDAPSGLYVPAQYMALWARRHQEVYGSTCEDLGQIAITQRAHAANNPHAIAREPLTMEEYLRGRWVNEPLRVFDCAYEVDGAVAIILTTPELAGDCASPPVWLLGAASAHTGAGFSYWDDFSTMYSRRVAPNLWRQTGLSASSVDVAVMYDCFTYTVMATLEDFGFCSKGEVGEWYAKGRATYGGDVVVNPHGGQLSEGYMQGLSGVYEAVCQLRGQAGTRQVPAASLALVTGGAAMGGGACVLGREPVRSAD
jgi:acetyl-CoA acetyltransferase